MGKDIYWVKAPKISHFLFSFLSLKVGKSFLLFLSSSINPFPLHTTSCIKSSSSQIQEQILVSLSFYKRLVAWFELISNPSFSLEKIQGQGFDEEALGWIKDDQARIMKPQIARNHQDEKVMNKRSKWYMLGFWLLGSLGSFAALIR